MNVYEIAEILISYGAKVNEKTKQNLTALMLSCLVDDNEQIVNLLCDNGANINDQDVYGDTAVMIAKKSKRSKVADLLIKRGACNDILCIPVDVD